VNRVILLTADALSLPNTTSFLAGQSSAESPQDIPLRRLAQTEAKVEREGLSRRQLE